MRTGQASHPTGAPSYLSYAMYSPTDSALAMPCPSVNLTSEYRLSDWFGVPVFASLKVIGLIEDTAPRQHFFLIGRNTEAVT